MPYTSAVTLSAINSAGSGWSQPKRLAVDDRGALQAIYVKANTSTVSQFRVEVGYGFKASAASAGMSGILLPMNAPAAANGWNVSATYGSATVYVYRENLADSPIRYDYNNPNAAPFIYSGTSLRNSGGVFVRARGKAGGSGGASVELKVLVDVS